MPAQKKRFSWSYHYVGRWVFFASRIFYRRFTIMGLTNFPSNKATILISNHQNGMMDPVMCCISTPEQLSFLTRADVFKKPIANKLAQGVNMLPIYRPIDRVNDMTERNDLTFFECIKRLEAGNTIAMFPEGNHGNRKFLRPFKKGLARLAFAAEEANDFELDVQIIPVGIEYSNYTDFRSDILLTYGKPIVIKTYQEEYKKDPNRANIIVLDEVSSRLSELIVDIKEKSLYDTFESVRYLYEPKMLAHLELDANHPNELKAYQTLIKSVEDKVISHLGEIEELKNESEKYSELLVDLKLDERVLASRSSNASIVLTELAMLLFFPVFLVGFLLSIIPFFIISEFVKKNIKDPHFKSSIKIAFGTFLFPIFWLLTGIIFWVAGGGFLNGIAVILAGPIFGIIAIKYWEAFKKLRQNHRIKRVVKNDGPLYSKLMTSRERIIEILDTLTK